MADGSRWRGRRRLQRGAWAGLDRDQGPDREQLSRLAPAPLAVTSIAACELGCRAIKLEVLALLCCALDEPMADVIAEAERRNGRPVTSVTLLPPENRVVGDDGVLDILGL